MLKVRVGLRACVHVDVFVCRGASVCVCVRVYHAIMCACIKKCTYYDVDYA